MGLRYFFFEFHSCMFSINIHWTSNLLDENLIQFELIHGNCLLVADDYCYFVVDDGIAVVDRRIVVVAVDIVAVVQDAELVFDSGRLNPMDSRCCNSHTMVVGMVKADVVDNILVDIEIVDFAVNFVGTLEVHTVVFDVADVPVVLHKLTVDVGYKFRMECWPL